jgi:hypothetical protein
MADNGLMAVRFYRQSGKGYARAWMCDVSKKVNSPEAYVLFNAYGLMLEEICGVVAAVLKLGSVPVSLRNNGGTHGTLFINRSGYGLLIAEPEVCKAQQSRTIELGLRRKYAQCQQCHGRRSRSTLQLQPDGRRICEWCAGRG